MIRSLTYLLLFFFSVKLYSQKTQTFIDSIKSVIETTLDPRQKADLLNELGTAFQDQNKDSALYYISQGLNLSEKTNYKKGIGLSLGNIGIVHESFGNYEKAVEYALKSLKIKEELDDKTGICVTLNSIAAVYYYQNNLDYALKYFSDALRIAEELHDTFKIAGLSGNIGNIYSEKGDYEKALEQHLYALKLSKLAHADDNGIYLSNIGLNYFLLKDYKKALQYYKEAIEDNKRLNNMNGLTHALNKAGELYMEQNNISPALGYFIEALEIASRANLRYEIKDIYMNLSKIYARLGDYKKAFEYHEFFSLTKDSLLNEENQRSINEMQAKYETGQKEKEIQIKNLQINERDAQIRGQRITIFASAGGLILLFLLAIVVFRAYKLKQKANLLLKKQKLEIEIQKGIIEEKNRDITDSITYAKHIQDAILPEKEKILQVLPESFILFMPKDIVSGDFYWYMQAGNGDILVASADCTGHGVPGAFMSMICSNTLTKIVSEYQLTQPGEVLTRLNKEIKSALKQKGENSSSRDGMDIALLKFSFGNDTCRVDFAGANRPLIYFENGNMREIVPNKSAIGGFTHDDYQFINHSASLKKDSMLYIFSDGYADQFGGANGKKFMLKNLKELFKTIRNLSIKEQEKILREVFLSWKGGLEQVDDVLVIGIRV